MSSFTESGSWLRNRAHSAATIGCFEVFRTDVAEPPQRLEVSTPFLNCGTFARVHNPVVFAAVPCSRYGPHGAGNHEAYVLVANPRYHASVKLGSPEISPA